MADFSLRRGRWQLVAEFIEIESGKRAKRPQLDAALAACKKNKAKLVVAKLDRLSKLPSISWQRFIELCEGNDEIIIMGADTVRMRLIC